MSCVYIKKYERLDLHATTKPQKCSTTPKSLNPLILGIPSTHSQLAIYLATPGVNMYKQGGLSKSPYTAPGKIATTSDGWMADNTKGAFPGMTTHWIKVKDDKWKLRVEVVGFQPILGEHSGENLGKYFVGLCDHIGIMNKGSSKVHPIMVRLCSIISTNLACSCRQ